MSCSVPVSRRLFCIEGQELQEAVLTLYHLMSIISEKGPAAKIFHSDLDRMYVKNWAQPQIQLQGLPIQIPRP